MLIILSANSSPADWVSILPYITSLHSSSCVCARARARAPVFLLPSFFQITSHFPRFPRRCSRRCGLQGDVEQYEDGEAKQRLKKRKKKNSGGRGGGEGKKGYVLKKNKNCRAAACRASGCESTPSCSLAAAKRQRANEAVDKYLITPTTNTQRAQTDKVLLMVSGCFE